MMCIIKYKGLWCIFQVCLEGVLEHSSGVCTGQTKQLRSTCKAPISTPKKSENYFRICEFPEKGT